MANGAVKVQSDLDLTGQKIIGLAISTAPGQPVTHQQIAGFGTSEQSPISVTASTYTPVLADKNRLVSMDNASAQTFTIPDNATVPFPLGTVLNVAQGLAGATTVAAASGVTIQKNSKITLVTDGQYAVWSAVKMATNTWLLTGQMVQT